MRRLARPLLNIATALSLLLCVATAGLWARSYRFTDRLDWADRRGWRAISSARGYVEIGLLRTDWSSSPEAFHGPRYQRDAPHGVFNWLLLMGGSSGDSLYSWEHAGFAWHERRNARRASLHGIAFVPIWSLVAGSAALPLARWAMWIRRRTRGKRRGHCPTCQYDLTANVSGVCPECGTTIV